MQQKFSDNPRILQELNVVINKLKNSQEYRLEDPIIQQSFRFLFARHDNFIYTLEHFHFGHEYHKTKTPLCSVYEEKVPRSGHVYRRYTKRYQKEGRSRQVGVIPK